MRVTKTEQRAVEVVDDVTCDRCGESCRGHIGNINGINAVVCGAYDSTHFHDDGQNVMIDVCEKCSAEWFATFKHNPLNRPQENDSDFLEGQ